MQLTLIITGEHKYRVRNRNVKLSKPKPKSVVATLFDGVKKVTDIYGEISDTMTL